MGNMQQQTTVAILAGGLGTRLRSVAPDRPKVLVTVHERPFLTYLLDQLAGFGVNRVLLLTGYRAAQVREVIGERYRGIRISYSEEPAPLGTGGALRHAREHFTAPSILLMNGDSYCGINLPQFVRDHRTGEADLSLAAVRVEDCSRFGKLHLNDDRNIIGFAEKQVDAGPGWINAGIYLLQAKLVDEIPVGRPVSFEREMIPHWMAAGKKVIGHCSGSEFLDIGTPESYAQAEEFFAAEVHAVR